MPRMFWANEENGTTSKGSTRSRCKSPNCGNSTTRTRTDLTQPRDFKDFHSYITCAATLAEVARQQGVSRWTLDRRFTPFWLIEVPNPGEPHRVYDQIFIDGTYTAAGCLLVAASYDHVIAWYWAKSETAQVYTQPLNKTAEFLCLVLDCGQGAYTAIKACWPNAQIQRCVVHTQRVICRYTASKPRTSSGQAIYTLR